MRQERTLSFLSMPLSLILKSLKSITFLIGKKINKDENPEVDTNNITSKAQRNKAQRSFQPVKAQRKIRNLIFVISEAKHNFSNELFDSVET